jgi:hypothetical protein
MHGLGAGILFIGFLFFQVPGNMALRRVGARRRPPLRRGGRR